MKIAVFFANGTEEIEALTPVDVFRRCNIECDVISVSGKNPTGSHNISIVADKEIENVNLNEYSAFVVPGGMPGAENIANNQKVVLALKQAYKKGKLIAAICASPAVVFAQKNIVSGKKMTCYPSEIFIKKIGCFYSEKDVEIEDNVITANGPKSAMKFALSICEKLQITPKF